MSNLMSSQKLRCVLDTGLPSGFAAQKDVVFAIQRNKFRAVYPTRKLSSLIN